MRSVHVKQHRIPTAILFLALLLSGSFLATWFGPVCSLLVNQAIIRHSIESQIEEMIPDSALVVFFLPEISNGDFCWTRKGREFSYKDEMYDIVRSSVQNGRKVLLCLNDKLEKKLIKDYAKRETDKRHPVRNIRNLNFSCINSANPFICLTPAMTYHYVIWTDNFKPEVTEILSPPPEANQFHRMNTVC